MVQAITLSSIQMANLVSFAESQLPNESCAFLLGHLQGDGVIVTEILQMTNADVSPYSFSIEPTNVLRAYQAAEDKKLEVVGIFHSHPGNPSPSTTDARYMELNPVVWLIYSTTAEKFGAYASESGIRQAELRIKD